MAKLLALGFAQFPIVFRYLLKEEHFVPNTLRQLQELKLKAKMEFVEPNFVDCSCAP